MQASNLDQRVTIQAPADTDDGYGGTIPGGWADAATVWASVEPLRGGEAIANMQVTARQTYRLWFRRSVSVTPANRLKWGDRILNVREAPDPRREQYRQVVAEEQEVEE